MCLLLLLLFDVGGLALQFYQWDIHLVFKTLLQQIFVIFSIFRVGLLHSSHGQYAY